MRTLANTAILIALALGPATAAADTMEMSKPLSGSAKLVETDAALRGLWVDHAFWVRDVVLATFAKNPAEAQAAEAQVVANAHALADSIEPFYGQAASDQLFALLAGHYGAVKAYLTATVAKNKQAEDAATEDMMTNAGKIADFLSAANPNLPKDAVLGLLQAHGGHHITQIQDLAGRRYAEEAKNWIDMKQHMFVIADALTGAIAKQFPEKF